MASSSLNAGDCFVLVADNVIRVWQGETSSGFEKNKAVAYAHEVAGDQSKVEIVGK